MTRRRLGVAIPVPEPHGSVLQRWRERFADPDAARIPPHVTLLPPTLVPEARLPEVEAHLVTVAGATTGFVVGLRGSATFQPVSPVVFVPLVAGVGGCRRLAARVRSGPLRRETRFPYHPHVTVLHDVAEPSLRRAYRAMAGFAAVFPVDSFGLFEQGADGVWRPRLQLPLRRAAGGQAGDVRRAREMSRALRVTATSTRRVVPGPPAAPSGSG